MRILFLIVNAISIYVSLAQTGTDLKNLWTNLFTTNSYDINLRPSIDQTAATLVKVQFHLAGINSFDEVAEKLTTTGYLIISWQDDYLSWTPSSFGNIQDFYYPQGNIWKPDISLQNGLSKMQELGSSFNVLNVQHSGTVTWDPFEVFETRCVTDTTYYPFDEQTCSLIFICWGYKATDVNMTISGNGVQLYEDFTSNGEWKVTKTDYNIDHDGLDVKITFLVTLKRKPQYFIINIIIPVVLVSLLNLFTLVIPCDSGERTGYAITVWLTFAVFLTIVSASLPQSSNSTSIIAIYLMIMLGLASLIVFTTTVQIRMNGLSEDEMEIPGFLSRMVLYTKRKKNKADSNEEKTEAPVVAFEDLVTWKEVISAIDFVLFWIFLLVILLVTVICLCLIATS